MSLRMVKLLVAALAIVVVACARDVGSDGPRSDPNWFQVGPAISVNDSTIVVIRHKNGACLVTMDGWYSGGIAFAPDSVCQP